MTTHTDAVVLRAGELRLALRPDLGASVAGLWLGDTPVLRSTEPAALQGPRASGCFPLAPYSNRLGYRHFRWQGRDHTTAPNFEEAYPHSLHGTSWKEPWRVTHADATSAVLSLTHHTDVHWPFTFDLMQRFELAPGGLRVSLVLTNIDARTQPVGLGWHPYFPKRSRSRIHIECSGRWESDPVTHLPTRRVAQKGIDGEVRHLDYDHCFDGWQGAARVRDEALAVSITSSLDHLVVFTPPARDYFCVEPVSHVSNAIQMADPAAHGLVALEAADTLEAWMQIEVSRA
ncbi:MAG: aldose 1-epimerase [Aquincola sp.]|nr:aldose 1-epimerase [Aquincola sp.]MDH4289404.1 aldose 1-epimerase [Aquincola sp.]MDH5330748.1 aldose 1-epimerase [Aquincola sp.]